MNIASIIGDKGGRVVKVSVNALLAECVQVLNDSRVGAVLVVDDSGNLKGILSERDILWTLAKHPGGINQISVSQVMTPAHKLVTAAPEDPIASVMQRMSDHHIRHLPVIDGGRIAGIISIGDVVKALLDLTKTENEHLKSYVAGNY